MSGARAQIDEYVNSLTYEQLVRLRDDTNAQANALRTRGHIIIAFALDEFADELTGRLNAVGTGATGKITAPSRRRAR